MAKEISFQHWVEDLLPEGYLRKPMFGGRGYYFNEKLILTIFENPGDRQYKDKIASYDIWNGCMFPVEREHHAEIIEKFPQLFNHPILGKWLYAPQDTEDFEDLVTKILRQIPGKMNLFGVIVKPKKKSKNKSKKKTVPLKKKTLKSKKLKSKIDSNSK
jgi:hypothetical protein